MEAGPVPPRAPSLLPREHGAWGQLALPLASALALGVPGAAALLLTAGIVLAFLAHEPMLIVLGQRGRRLLGDLGDRARRRLAVLGLAAAVTGGAGLLLAPGAARAAVLPAAVLGACSVGLAVVRLEKTTAGEVLVSWALAAAAIPVALAAGAPARHAWAAGATWALAFTAATLPVRVILLRARTKGAVDRRLLSAAGVAALTALALLAGALGLVPWPAALAVLPVTLAAFVVSLAPLRAQRLTAVGWSVVGASLATLLVLVLGLRLGG